MATLDREDDGSGYHFHSIDAFDEAILSEKSGGYMFSFPCNSDETEGKRLDALGNLFLFHKEGHDYPVLKEGIYVSFDEYGALCPQV